MTTMPDKCAGPRNLTVDDVNAICDELESRMEERFFSNLGKGVFAWIKKAVMLILIALAAYGAGVTKYSDYFHGAAK